MVKADGFADGVKKDGVAVKKLLTVGRVCCYNQRPI